MTHEAPPGSLAITQIAIVVKDLRDDGTLPPDTWLGTMACL
jgi:hypothetical protein